MSWRLSAASLPLGLKEYLNRKTSPTKKIKEQYTYNEADQLTKLTTILEKENGSEVTDSEKEFTYNLNGNLLSETVTKDRHFFNSESTRDYIWNQADRLAKITEKSGWQKKGTVLASFMYDGNGRRIQETTGKEPVNFYHDGLNLALSIQDKDVTSFTAGLNIDEVLSSTQGKAHKKGFKFENDHTGYFHTDHLNSTRLITDSHGTVKNRFDYMPFGEIKELPPFDNKYKTDVTYTGREKVADTGLYYYRNRYYTPETGRFLSKDAVFNMNRYAYVENNPVRFVDPLGLLKIGSISSSKINSENLKEYIKNISKNLENAYRSTGTENDLNNLVNNIPNDYNDRLVNSKKSAFANDIQKYLSDEYVGITVNVIKDKYADEEKEFIATYNTKSRVITLGALSLIQPESSLFHELTHAFLEDNAEKLMYGEINADNETIAKENFSSILETLNLPGAIIPLLKKDTLTEFNSHATAQKYFKEQKLDVKYSSKNLIDVMLYEINRPNKSGSYPQAWQELLTTKIEDWYYNKYEKYKKTEECTK